MKKRITREEWKELYTHHKDDVWVTLKRGKVRYFHDKQELKIVQRRLMRRTK